MSAASDVVAEPVFLTREEILSPPKLEEKVVTFDGWGSVLCGELTGDARAEITEKQARAMREDTGGVIKGYQKALLREGILDPTSPETSRTQMLRSADVDGLMKTLGGSRVRELVVTIEQLSGLGFVPVAVEPALETAVKNSEDGPSAVGTTE